MHAPQIATQTGPLTEAINADLQFWEWFEQNRSGTKLSPVLALRTAQEIASLHLPFTAMGKRTTTPIAKGTYYIAQTAERWQRTAAFNEIVLELSSDASMDIVDLPNEIFQYEASKYAKLALYQLAKIVAQPLPAW